MGEISEHVEGSQGNCVDDPNHRTCVDPETFDPEAFDCNCFDRLEQMTISEIRDWACGNADVCCDWKRTYCSASFVESQQAGVATSLSEQASGLLEARGVRATSAKGVSEKESSQLDETLQDK